MEVHSFQTIFLLYREEIHLSDCHNLIIFVENETDVLIGKNLIKTSAYLKKIGLLSKN